MSLKKFVLDLLNSGAIGQQRGGLSNDSSASGESTKPAKSARQSGGCSLSQLWANRRCYRAGTQTIRMEQTFHPYWIVGDYKNWLFLSSLVTK
jgi:hypothetical protein